MFEKSPNLNNKKKEALALLVASGLSAGVEAADNTGTVEDKTEHTIEYTAPVNTESSRDYVVTSKDFEGRTEKGKENKAEAEMTYKINLKAGFEMGGVTMSMEKKNELTVELSTFFKNLPEEILVKLNNGELVIESINSASHHSVRKEGIRTEDGRLIYTNKEVVEERAQISSSIISKALNVSGLEYAEVKTKKQVLSQEESSDVLNEGRYIEINIKENNPFSKENISDIAMYVVDQSASMNQERSNKETLIDLENVNRDEGDKIMVVNIEGSHRGEEKIITTVEKISHYFDQQEVNYEDTKYVIIETDEAADETKGAGLGELRELRNTLNNSLKDLKEKHNIEVKIIYHGPKGLKPIIAKASFDILKHQGGRDVDSVGNYENIKKIAKQQRKESLMK